MTRSCFRLFLALLFPLAFAASGSARAQTNSLSATFTLANLPTTITLCRDPVAVAALRSDEQWFALIDVDGDFNVDVAVLVQTLGQQNGCTPVTANTAQSLEGTVLKWSAADNNFIDTGATVAISEDFTAHTITVTTDLAGALAGLSNASHYALGTAGVYTPSASGTPTSALDQSSSLQLGVPVTLPAGNVQQCTAPCSAAASWYPLVDLVGAEVSTAQALPAFGKNTMYVEFDLASLPATVDLCRYPGLPTGGASFSDSNWLAAFAPTGADTGNGSGGFETIVVAYTTPQTQSCSANSAPMASSIQAELDKWDAAQQTYVMVASLPVDVDVASGKIVVQADRSAAPFASLSAASKIIESGSANYLQAGTLQSAFDLSSSFGLGASFTDPTQDVQSCTAPCSTAVSWYPQIDLIGGSVHLVDEIFGDGFDP